MNLNCFFVEKFLLFHDASVSLLEIALEIIHHLLLRHSHLFLNDFAF